MRDLILFNDRNYLRGINKAISIGRHPDQLREFLKEYKDYQKVLTPLFSKYNNPTNNIFTFLVHFDYPKRITRMDEKRSNFKIERLHY